MRANTAALAALLAASGADAQLNQLMKAAGKLYFGTATDNQQVQGSDTRYQSILGNTAEFGIITPANTMKWQYTETANGQFSYTQGDVIANWAQSHNQMLRCHNLVWHAQLPSFISSGSWTNASLTQVMQAHIASEVGHYKGKCYAWDVVNEAFNEDGSLVSDPFSQHIGAAYIPLAFQAAGQADPAAQLYYNDYNIETAGAKLNAALALVPKIRAIGARIDAIGFESHFIVGQTPSASALTSAMNSVTALNLHVAITELDVRFSSLPPSSAGLTQQANDYAGVVQACLNVAGCVGVTVWDFDDQYSWIPGTFSGSGDADLYWSNYTVKPAYNSIVSLLKAHATSSTSASSTKTTTVATSTTFVTTTTSAAAPPPPPTTTAPPTTTSPSGGGGSQSHWGQCGGIGYGGPTACAAPYACSTQNAYYAQCL